MRRMRDMFEIEVPAFDRPRRNTPAADPRADCLVAVDVLQKAGAP